MRPETADDIVARPNVLYLASLADHDLSMIEHETYEIQSTLLHWEYRPIRFDRQPVYLELTAHISEVIMQKILVACQNDDVIHIAIIETYAQGLFTVMVEIA